LFHAETIVVDEYIESLLNPNHVEVYDSASKDAVLVLLSRLSYSHEFGSKSIQMKERISNYNC